MTANVRAAFDDRSPSASIPGVKHVIAVASGKGGVGKSTVAVNLAASLRQSGARVGLLDADIYGPSVPGMLGVEAQPAVHEGKLLPLDAHGMKVISIGLLAGADKAMVWRGLLSRKPTRASRVSAPTISRASPKPRAMARASLARCRAVSLSPCRKARPERLLRARHRNVGDGSLTAASNRSSQPLPSAH